MRGQATHREGPGAQSQESVATLFQEAWKPELMQVSDHSSAESHHATWLESIELNLVATIGGTVAASQVSTDPLVF